MAGQRKQLVNGQVDGTTPLEMLYHERNLGY